MEVSKPLPFDAAFAPSAQSGRLLDAAVRSELAASIDAIATALDGALGIDRDAIAALTAAIRLHPIRPAIMGLYASLVPALLQDEPKARAILAALAEPDRRARIDFRIVSIDDDDLGAGMSAIYREHVNDDPAVPILFQPLTGSAMREARLRVIDAIALLKLANPPLAAEIRALINEILIVRHDAEAGGISFNGASTFHLWGALVLNIDAFPARLNIVQGLAHESAHTLLHGLTMGQTAVLNDPADRYPSPLREDDRPMEGVVHATFVLARMHLALESVLRAGNLDAAEREMAARDLYDIRQAYTAGLGTVRAGACFTKNGAAAFAQAEAYMARRLAKA